MNYVAQEHEEGCVVACLAMILGIPYWSAQGLLGGPPIDGILPIEAEQILAMSGWACQLILRRPCMPWPPAPWAPCHLVRVEYFEKCEGMMVAGCSHMVVMDHDGVILDPQRPGRYTIGNFVVSSIRGLFPVDTGPHW